METNSARWGKRSLTEGGANAITITDVQRSDPMSETAACVPGMERTNGGAWRSTVLEVGLDATLVIDHHGRVTDFNPAAEKVLGYSRADVLGQDLGGIITPPATRDGQSWGLAGLLSTSEGAVPGGRIETIAQCADGTEIPIELTILPLPYHDPPRFMGCLRDITVRKRAEAALAESEERLRFALQAAKMVAWDWDLVTGQILQSEDAEELLSLELPRATDFFDQIHLEDRPAVEAAIARALSGGALYDEEFRMVTAEGDLRWVRDRAQVTFGADGRPLRMAGVCVDVTEHKKATEALRTGERRFRALIEKSFDGVALLGSDGVVQYVSPAVSRVLGYATDEFIERNIAEFTHPEDQAEVGSAFTELLEMPGASLTYECRVRHKEGMWRWIECTVTNLLADPSVFAIVGNFRDITERKRAGEALQRSEERFKGAFESAAIGMALVSPDGRWLQVNASLCEIVGYTEAELLATTFQAITHPDDLESDLECVRQMLAGEIRTYQMEKRYLHKGGQIVWILLSASLVRDTDKQPLYFIAQIKDITARKRAEVKLQEFTAQLERSNRELQEFAYVASHDLQEPLRKIETFADRLKTKHGGVLNEEGRDYLERMQNAATRMRTLVHDLLAFSRVTTQARPFVPVDLDAVARDVLIDLETLLERTGGTVELDGLPTIDADPTQMRQLLQNLIGNALKFRREGEQPLVRVWCETLPSERKTRSHGVDGCRLFVTDNGIGFEEKYLDRIFNPFQRLHGRGEYEGTGIGLAICRKIAERHGGTITASSQPDQGATFAVMLPSKQSGSEQ
jgi:PAS domain S-box-containing protein